MLRRILTYLRPHWKQVIVIYIALFGALAMQLSIPMVLANAIDQGIGGRDFNVLVHAGLLIVGLTAIQGIFTFARSYFVQAVAERVGYDLRNEIFGHLQALPFAYHDRARTGQLMSRATEDINNIRAALVMTMRPLALAIGTFLAVSVILLREDRGMALIALAPLPFLVVISIRFGVSLRPVFHGVQQQFGVMTNALQENVAGHRVVRAFAQERAESDKFEHELDELFERNMTASSRWAFAYPLTLFLSGLGMGAVLWYGGRQVLAEALTVGTLVAFNRYMVLLNEPVRWLGFVVNRVARAAASGERIFEVLDTRPVLRDNPGAVALDEMRGAIRFDDVTFAFGGAKRNALDHVSFTAEPGTVTGLIGATGAGKSAIINLIPRFYDVDSGQVSIDGHDVRELTLASLRSQIGIVMQETFLFSASIAENIAYGKPNAPRAAVEAAAKAAGAHDFISVMPDGYETETGERGVSLSGGQKQRIAIARALLLNPRILILDDATSSVDSETEIYIQDQLQRLMRGRTSIVIAQRASSVAHADQILVLHEGRLVDRGTPAELLARPGFYRELNDLQQQDRQTAFAATVSGEGQAS